MNAFWRQASSKKLLAILALVVAVIVVYFPGLNGPFVFDDEIHVLSDPSVRISSLNFQSLANVVVSEDGSLFNRPLAKITLAINYYFTGGTSTAFGYKLTNLGIHLVNTGLVYWFSLLLFRQQATRRKDFDKNTLERIPILVAALWAIHPLHLTTVLYVVQRMTSLSAFFVLAGLIVFIRGRQRVQEKREYGYLLMATGAIGGTALGLACKENAAVILPLMLVIEFIFFGTSSETPSDNRKLRRFYGVIVLAPATLLGLWLIAHPNFILDPYISRNFTPVERLLTEPRILWYYVSLLFIPDVRRMSLYHDDIPVSSGLFDPWTTSIALFSTISIVIFALIARRKYPFISFAILWFLIGHSIESSVIGLEIAHEHRNYLPDIGVLLAVGYGLSMAASRFRRPIRYAILLAPLITLGFATNTLARTWANEEDIIKSLARQHPGSARGQYMLAELYAEKKHDYLNALAQYRKAAELAPNETGYLVKSAVTAAKMDFNLGRDTNNASYRSMDSEIVERQLKERPLTASTLDILDQLARCTDQTTHICRLLYTDIKNWYFAVIQNPYISSKERGNFIVYLFNLGTSRPDLDSSLQAARLGKNLEPSNPVYSLMEANVYILRGELETAEGLLQTVLKNPVNELTSEIKNDTTVLFAEIESRRNRLQSKQNSQKMTVH
jgi:hypothetical protein